MRQGRWAVALLGLVGCVTSNTLHPNELVNLDGYRGEQAPAAREEPEVHTLEGDRLTVRSAEHARGPHGQDSRVATGSTWGPSRRARRDTEPENLALVWAPR